MIEHPSTCTVRGLQKRANMGRRRMEALARSAGFDRPLEFLRTARVSPAWMLLRMGQGLTLLPVDSDTGGQIPSGRIAGWSSGALLRV